MPTLARVFSVLYNAVYGLEQDKSISSELRTSVKSLKYRSAKALCEEALTMAVFFRPKKKATRSGSQQRNRANQNGRSIFTLLHKIVL
jgi:hypothetical protein